MEHYYIVVNQPKDQELKITHQIEALIKKHGKQCTLQMLDEKYGQTYYTDSSHIPKDVDCIIVLGGDGTLLQAARDTIDRQIPLLGINLGTLGYLAEVECANLEMAMDSLCSGAYEIEERMMISGTILRGETILADTYALNDIVITRSGSLRILKYDIRVDGQFLKGYHADGIIISTPTGSTGYNMSAGGPIVEPKANLMVVTPICPHTFNTRSIVLSEQAHVEIEVVRGKSDKIVEAEVSFDGTHTTALQIGDKIQIKRSSKVTKIIKISQVSFLEMLHKKMREA